MTVMHALHNMHAIDALPSETLAKQIAEAFGVATQRPGRQCSQLLSPDALPPAYSSDAPVEPRQDAPHESTGRQNVQCPNTRMLEISPSANFIYK